MKRAILYYPHMEFENPRWLRQMILYWDEIGTIIPNELTKKILDRNLDMKILSDYGIYRSFPPEHYVWQSYELENEFMSIINSEKFKSPREYFTKYDLEDSHARKHRYVHAKKVSPRLRKYLIGMDIADLKGEWVKMARKHSWVYMSLLAKYLANDDEYAITTPGTDYRSYLDLVYSTADQNSMTPAVTFAMNDVLPTPRDDITIKKIIEFKIKRELDLLKFRQVIYKYQDGLKNAKDKTEVVDLLDRFSTEIRIEIEQLDKLFTAAKIPITLGALENILKIGTPTLIAGLATLGSVPLPLTIAGTVVAGSITLRKYQLDVRNEQQQKLAANSYSYLYRAKKEGVI